MLGFPSVLEIFLSTLLIELFLGSNVEVVMPLGITFKIFIYYFCVFLFFKIIIYLNSGV